MKCSPFLSPEPDDCSEEVVPRASDSSFVATQREPLWQNPVSGVHFPCAPKQLPKRMPSIIRKDPPHWNFSLSYARSLSSGPEEFLAGLRW
jgi:hypothetical protein